MVSLSWAQDYLIGPEDVIEVAVWKEPDVSRVVLVRPDGKISLPLIGDVQAEGIIPHALAENLRKAFAAYIQTPNVSVIVQQINSRRVYILGRVKNPTVVPLRSELTVLQAITMAGGFAEWAKKGKVVILRSKERVEQRIVIDLNKVIDGKKSNEDIRLRPGDRIIVP